MDIKLIGSRFSYIGSILAACIILYYANISEEIVFCWLLTNMYIYTLQNYYTCTFNLLLYYSSSVFGAKKHQLLWIPHCVTVLFQDLSPEHLVEAKKKFEQYDLVSELSKEYKKTMYSNWLNLADKSWNGTYRKLWNLLLLFPCSFL